MKYTLLALFCVWGVSLQVSAAEVRTSMLVSAFTLPSDRVMDMVLISDPEADVYGDDPTRYLPSSAAGWGASEEDERFKKRLLQQVIQLPQGMPYMISFEGKYSRYLRFVISDETALIVDGYSGGSEDWMADAMVMILLGY